MNYRQTLIAVADDCPVTSSAVPAPRGGRKTVAVVQYQMLTERPRELTQEDVLFMTWLRRHITSGDMPEAELLTLRERFFSKEQPCLRCSPLPRKYGFGLLFDGDGLVSLCPVESAEYESIVEHPGPTKVLMALRSKRR